jgi:uncharacterized caspase-like protein
MSPSYPTPPNDAALIAKTLRELRFSEVIENYDLTLSQMVGELKEFGDKVAVADWAVVYFAGHGIEMGGNAYLIAADATLALDARICDEAYPLERVLEKVDRARLFRPVIVDACRNNPFAARMVTSGSGQSRGPPPELEPTEDVFMAYASKHGTVAEDGDRK